MMARREGKTCPRCRRLFECKAGSIRWCQCARVSLTRDAALMHRYPPQDLTAVYRVIADPNEVVRRTPDIIIGSWCGKRFRPERVKARAGWDAILAVQTGHVYEIKSADILQPGPAALGDRLAQIHRIIMRWATALTYALMDDAPRALRCWRSQGVLTRLFPDPPSLRFGLPGTKQDWMRLEAALAVPYTGASSR